MENSFPLTYMQKKRGGGGKPESNGVMHLEEGKEP